MTGPQKNRLHDYEAGWLTLMIEMGLATTEEAHEAMCRVAQAAVEPKETRKKKNGDEQASREQKRTPRKRRKPPE